MIILVECKCLDILIHVVFPLNEIGINIQDLSNQNQNVKTNNGSHQHSEITKI
jgi:hypothetical protein